MSAAHDTIVAIATPPGSGGVGIVRLSGARVPQIARSWLGKLPPPRRVRLAVLRDADGETIDRALVLRFEAPRSFTGEHVLELHAHGAPVVLAALQARACELGARPARAGEFSERAFLNGKLDLTQAEAIADLIASKSSAQARAAMRSLQGEFSTRVRSILQALVELRAHVEATIDFPEDEIDFLADPALRDRTERLRDNVSALVVDARNGVRLTNGLHVVIAGRPNVGKSSLLNALAAEERAIVSGVPGTTRDVLREDIRLDGIAITLADTAGLRESPDVVEAEGVRRARSEAQRADLVLLVTEPGEAESDLRLLEALPEGVERLVLVNKIDLHGRRAVSEIRGGAEIISLSAKTGEGLQLLRDSLKRRAGAEAAEHGAFSARARHVFALENARKHIDAAAHALYAGRAGELAAEDLRQAQRCLGEITGEFTSDDLLGAIFSSFCIGK